MDPAQAWQHVLEQLQIQLPKASFDTWVRDAVPVSCEGGRFTIGVRNAYARDWLEVRLTATIVNLLSGILDRPVEVCWTVVPEVEEEIPTPDADAPPVEETGAPDKDLLVEAHYDLAYDEIVIPDHVTLVPRYFLRHLRLIGPDLAWLYLGFRQAAFNAGARSGTKRERFSGKTIAALSGIAVSTFWNRIGKDETWKRLRGLVTTTEAAPAWDLNSATPKRLPRRYVVAMSLPLTAVDARSLRTWLTANLERMGGPEGVIEAAAETPLDELLPPDTQAQECDVPESVSEILRTLFGVSLPPERMAALATRLNKHIMPDKDRLGVTHFFVEHILPHLSAGPGWMLTLLRDRCYVNRDTGEVRNQVRITNGYAEIASWMGVTPETVWRWLQGKHSESRGRSKASKGGSKRGPGRLANMPGKLTNPVLRIYARETTGKVPSIWTSPRSFDILLSEVPDEILEAAFDEPASQALDYALSTDDELSSDDCAVCSIGMALFSTPSKQTARFVVSGDAITARFVASDDPITARYVDDSRAVCSIVTARFVDHLRAVCRVFKSLNYLTPITNDSPTPLPPSTERRPVRGSGNQAYWDFDFLMANNQVERSEAIRRRQKQTGASIGSLTQGFVSWLLYAYSPSGRRVDDPVALAAKRLLQNVHTGAGSDYDCLARLRPFELRALFDQDLAGVLYEVPDTIEKDVYTVKFGDLSRSYKRELYRRLFGGED